MRIDIVTLFPPFFDSPMSTSMLRRASQDGFMDSHIHDLRDFATDTHKSVDDTPYGGGGGMVLKPEPVFKAWEALDLADGYCVYPTADGEPFNQCIATELSMQDRLVLFCGHYKGVDERIRQHCVHREISIGDYVLTGGEPASVVIIDAVVRLIPGVLGNFESALDDSFHDDLLDCPWYTRPEQFLEEKVPDVLLSGNHGKVKRWRRAQALRRTFERRPDLLEKADLDEGERALVNSWSSETSKNQKKSTFA